MHGQVLVTSQVFNRCSRHQAGGVRHDFQPRRLHSTDAEAPQHHLVRVGVRVRVRIGVRVRVRLLRIRVRRRSTTLLDVSGLLSLSQLGIVQYRLWLCGVVGRWRTRRPCSPVEPSPTLALAHEDLNL